MISCFPDPHPDELLFSVYARFDAMMPYLHRGIAVREMFGVEYAAAAIDLPNRIDHLIGSIVISHNYTADGLVDDNTLFPLYAPFIPPERALAVRREMRASGSNHVYERLGITAGRLKPPTRLKFCPECVSDDKRLCGETYWHRVHQAPGVEVCPHHSVFLEVSKAPWRTSKSREEVMTAERAVHATSPRPLDLSNDIHRALLKLAEGAAWLLEWRGQTLDNEVLLNRYHNLLLRRGLAFFNGRVRSSELTKKFIEFYTPDLLESLQCPIGNQGQHWLLRLVYRGKLGIIQHPLRHLLLMVFLDRTPKEVFTDFKEFKPFGDGPWPCLNKASAHFEQLCVENCRVEDGFKKNFGKPVGTFTCECGFTYTRTGPDETEKDRLKKSSVQSYGHVWEKSLRALWDDTSLTLRVIADRLGVNELTVKRRAIQLGFTYPRNTPGSLTASGEILDRYRIVQKPFDEELEARRGQFLAVRRANPEAGRLRLQEIAFSLLDWLRRHDPDWLEDHLPAVDKHLPRPTRVDWESWDVKLAAEVEAAAAQIKSVEGSPVRVSITAIVNEIGHRAWFEKSLDRLPLTAEAVSKHVESFEGYLLRKVKWAEDYYRRLGVFPTRHKFEEFAGVRDRKSKTRRVQDAVDSTLKSLAGGRSSEPRGRTFPLLDQLFIDRLM